MKILLNGEPCDAEVSITTDPVITFDDLMREPPFGTKVITEITARREGHETQRIITMRLLPDGAEKVVYSHPLSASEIEFTLPSPELDSLISS